MAVSKLDQGAARPKKSTTDHTISVPIPAIIYWPFWAVSAVSTSLASELARQIFFRPVRTRPNPVQQAILTAAESLTLSFEGRKLALFGWGEGPVVLLVHGWSGHAGQMTEFVAPLMSAGYKVVALDLPAHGQSGGQLSSVVHFGGAIQAVADQIGPVHAIVAHSLGAAGVVQAFLGGLTAKRAVLISPPAQFHDYWGLFRSRMRMSHAVWRALVERSERWLGVPFPEIHPECNAPRMAVPALILHGTADRVSPVSEGRRLVQLWPRAALREFDTGHVSILRDARAVTEAVRFIKG
jgi:alpha-beta hydrolase superfamily lysophospholipase